MFCLVAGDENKKICIACEDKQWCFTLDMTNEFGTKFYSLLETNKLFTIGATLYDNPNNAEVEFESTDIILSENALGKQNSYEAGDIMIYQWFSSYYMDILAVDETDWFDGSKVGELEKSFINDFNSFIEGKINSGLSDVSFTFSIKQPELDTKIIVTSIIWLLLLLPLLFLVYFIFK